MRPTDTHIQNLIVKYVTSSITSSEVDELDLWLQEPENENRFKDFIKTNYFIDCMMKDFKTQKAKQLLLDQIRKDKNLMGRKRSRKLFKYAATVILLLGLGYILKDTLFPVQYVPVLEPKQNFVTLELDNGSIKVISEDGSSTVKDAAGEVVAEQKGGEIVYYNAANKEELAYNTLNVPYGRQFKLELSDSSIVYLNAGSSLKYPIRFLEGGNREVFLTGEAFFEVYSDKERPFLVNSGNMEIQVLGTRFNVSAYPEDDIKEVVLVEGSVKLSGGSVDNNAPDGAATLEPGMKGNFDIVRHNITTESVITDIYTSWVDGELVFRNMDFKKILKKLERHYNVVIINKSGKMDNVEFNASFRKMPITKIMDYFKDIYDLDYSQEGDKIIIE